MYHITYPTVDVSAVSTIANFPDEAEYLVVLYAAAKQLLQYQSTMSSSFNSDITTAITAVNTELDETQAIADNIHTEIGLINAEVDKATAEIALANTEVDKMAAEVGLDNAEVDLAKAELAEAATLIDGGIDTATAAITTAAGRVNTAVGLANGQFDAAVLESAQAEGEADDGAIATALGLINTQTDNAVAGVGDVRTYLAQANTRIATAKSEIDLAKGEAAEIVTQTDNSGDIATALTAINTELDKVDEVIVLASTEFDKTPAQIVLASAEYDKCDTVLDLGEADTEGAVNTALTAVKAEMDETQGVCDKIDADLVLAKALHEWD